MTDGTTMGADAGTPAPNAPAAGNPLAAALGAPGADAGGTGEGGAAAPAVPEWLNTLPPEMKTDDMMARLSRMPDVPSLAKAFIETHDWARGRVALPDPAKPETLTEFFAKVRPEKPEDYKLAVPEGDDGSVAEAFRPIFHDIGLHADQAAKLSEHWNTFQQNQIAAQNQKGAETLKALELELGAGTFERGRQAVFNMLSSAGINVEAIAPGLQLAAAGDAGAAMRALMTLAEKTGELAKVDGDTVSLNMGLTSPAQAREQARAMARNDKDGKLRDPKSPERIKYDALVAKAAQTA